MIKFTAPLALAQILLVLGVCLVILLNKFYVCTFAAADEERWLCRMMAVKQTTLVISLNKLNGNARHRFAGMGKHFSESLPIIIILLCQWLYIKRRSEFFREANEWNEKKTTISTKNVTVKWTFCLSQRAWRQEMKHKIISKLFFLFFLFVLLWTFVAYF